MMVLPFCLHVDYWFSIVILLKPVSLPILFQSLLWVVEYNSFSAEINTSEVGTKFLSSANIHNHTNFQRQSLFSAEVYFEVIFTSKMFCAFQGIMMPEICFVCLFHLSTIFTASTTHWWGWMWPAHRGSAEGDCPFKIFRCTHSFIHLPGEREIWRTAYGCAY